jgi:hypothetical protein
MTSPACAYQGAVASESLEKASMHAIIRQGNHADYCILEALEKENLRGENTGISQVNSVQYIFIDTDTCFLP